jgi:hypothetical protein
MEAFGAVHIGGGKMIVFEERAKILISKYF